MGRELCQHDFAFVQLFTVVKSGLLAPGEPDDRDPVLERLDDDEVAANRVVVQTASPPTSVRAGRKLSCQLYPADFSRSTEPARRPAALRPRRPASTRLGSAERNRKSLP